MQLGALGDSDSSDEMELNNQDKAKLIRTVFSPNKKGRGKFSHNNLNNLDSESGPAKRNSIASNENIESILEKIDANNFNINLKQLDEVKEQFTFYSKEFNKYFKKIRTTMPKK